MIAVLVLLMIGQVITASPQIAAIQSNSIQPLPQQTPAEEEQKNVPAPLVKSVNEKDSVIRCDGNFICPDHTSCCRFPFGRWICCPYTLGQCCRDGLHCCPFGYHCDSTFTRCIRGALSLPASPQIAAIQSNSIQPLSQLTPAEEEQKNVPAPLVKSVNEQDAVIRCDSNNYCPDHTSCCRFPSGRWMCCPYTLGQCCRDGLHCCPFGYHCDSTSTRCLRGELSLPASPQITAIQSNNIQKQAGVIHCSNRFYCPAGNSCCKTLTGQLACCPYPLGQCCKDGKHCCEYGYDCNSTFTKCIKHYASVPALLTKKALVL